VYAFAVDFGRLIMTAPRLLVVPGGTAIGAVALAEHWEGATAVARTAGEGLVGDTRRV